MSDIEFTVQDVKLQPRGEINWLKIIGLYRYNGEEPITIISGIASLTIHNTSFPSIPLPYRIFRRFERKGSDQFELDFPIDENIIQRIEMSRKETTVDLHMGLDLVGQKSQDMSINQVYIHQTQPYTIKTKKWMEIIRGLKLNQRWQITIITPTGSLAPAIEGAEKEFENAYQSLISGKYDDVLVSCRKVFENLWEIAGNKSQGGGVWPKNGQFLPQLSSILDQPHQPTGTSKQYSERLYNYIESLYKLTHQGAHIGYQLNRPNAELCYSGIALILQVLCEPLLQLNNIV